MTKETERLFTRRQVAELLGKHYATIRRWEENGQIEVHSYIKRGGVQEPRFTEEEVQRQRGMLEWQPPIAALAPASPAVDLAREVEALRRENELLRAEVARERALVDMLRQDFDRERSLVDMLLPREHEVRPE